MTLMPGMRVTLNDCRDRGVGTIVRKHEVEGAWYVSLENGILEVGRHGYDLTPVASTPFEDSVYAYIQKELALWPYSRLATASRG